MFTLCVVALRGIRAKTGLFEIRIMCPNGAICLSADCCIRQLALSKIPKQ